MSDVQWVCWEGGPHILLPEVALPLWEGCHPPAHGRIVAAKTHCEPTEPQTDYDRACDVEELAGVIRVGTHDAVIFGDEVPMSTLVRDSDGSLAVVIPMTWDDENAFNSIATLRRIATEAAPRQSTGLRINHPGGPIVLQAAVDASGEPLGGRIVAELDKGEYEVRTFDGWTEPGEVRIYVLHRIPNPG